MAHEVTLITGDGTGPELAAAAQMCVDATGVKINWDVQEAGVDVMAKLGTPLPDSVLASAIPLGVRTSNSSIRSAAFFATARTSSAGPRANGVRSYMSSTKFSATVNPPTSPSCKRSSGT